MQQGRIKKTVDSFFEFLQKVLTKLIIILRNRMNVLVFLSCFESSFLYEFWPLELHIPGYPFLLNIVILETVDNICFKFYIIFLFFTVSHNI